MNTVRIGVITIWAAVGVTGYLSLRDAVTGEAPPAQATRAQSAQIARAQSTNRAASHRAIDRRAEHSLDMPALNTVTEPALDPDTSDVTQPSQTQNQVFDALNADIGPEGEYVDPQALAAALGSDPELGRLLNP
jgi:hypothetical protein